MSLYHAEMCWALTVPTFITFLFININIANSWPIFIPGPTSRRPIPTPTPIPARPVMRSDNPRAPIRTPHTHTTVIKHLIAITRIKCGVTPPNPQPFPSPHTQQSSIFIYIIVAFLGLLR